MNTHRFDTLTKTLATRLSRRTALRSLGTGVATSAAGLAALNLRGATAQESTPDAPEASLAAGGTIELLFVQTASGGSLVPVPGDDGTYTLTLIGETGQTVYFADRPSRAIGAVATVDFVDGRAFDPADPPNAALVAQTDAGQDVLVMELTEPVFDAETGTMTYTARPLTDYQGEGLSQLAAMQQDIELAETFGAASLFVDNLACRSNGSTCGSDSDCCSKNCEIVGANGVPMCQ